MVQIMIELGDRPGATADEARRLERAGFDGVAAGEHLFFHGPVPNSFVSLAAAAGATTTVRLLSALALIPLYRPVVVAKLATSLDVVSGGRLDFGVGVGGEFPPEFVAAGVDRHSRGARADETLALLKRFWTGEAVTHHSESVTVPGLRINPPPAQPGGPPIWVGGRSRAAAERAGRLGDVWMPYMVVPEQLRAGLDRARDTAAAHGREPAEVRGALYCILAVDPDGARARRTAVDQASETYAQDFEPLADRYLLHGDSDTVLAKLRRYVDAGAETVVASIAGTGRDRDATIDLLAQDVLPVAHGWGERTGTADAGS